LGYFNYFYNLFKKINKNSFNFIFIASQRGHLSVVTLLIQANASVNIKDDYGRTALYYGKSSLIKQSTV
jgi:hypothetical protein